MYPAGVRDHGRVAGLSEPLEGAVAGREHFDGVATVVAKLLNIVAPQVAYFGQKDAQQALVIARMARDLDIPARIEVCPTVREPRRARAARAATPISATADRAPRGRAPAGAARAPPSLIARRRARAAGAAAAAARGELAGAAIEPDYLARRRPPRRSRPSSGSRVPVLVALAARVGPARLIDNVIATPGRRRARTSDR